MTDIVERLRASEILGGIEDQAADEIERLRHDLARAMENHSADLARLAGAEALLREASPALQGYSGEPDYIDLFQRIDAFLGSKPR